MSLVLASGSATRRRMLESAGVAFQVVAPDVDEAGEKDRLTTKGTRDAEIAAALAELKARSIRADNSIVLGSDQVLVTGSGEMLSKAATRDEAERQLSALSGRAHFLHSAAVLMEGGKVVWRATETATLRMRSFDSAFLASYLDAEWESVRTSVGCYRIEGRGVQLFERIEGSYFAILGMPLLPLLAELRRRGLLAS